jgi:ABC-type transport system involved in cytochrome bd biosynthesis fused ATPase/permease subunit
MTSSPAYPPSSDHRPAEVDVAIRPAVDVVGLSKSYGDHVVLRDVAFSVAPGEIFGLLGSNGAGKTTTVGTGGIGGHLAALGIWLGVGLAAVVRLLRRPV